MLYHQKKKKHLLNNQNLTIQQSSATMFEKTQWIILIKNENIENILQIDRRNDDAVLLQEEEEPDREEIFPVLSTCCYKMVKH